MTNTTIKRLEFPEFHFTLLGIDNQPICMLDDMTLAADVASGLNAALPDSAIACGTLWKNDIVSLLGVSPETAASNDMACYANETEMDQVWDDWLNNTLEAELLALYDLKYGAPSDPFFVNDFPQLDFAEGLHFHDSLANEMTAREMDEALHQHPDVMLTATVFKEDILRMLEELGYEDSKANLTEVQE